MFPDHVPERLRRRVEAVLAEHGTGGTGDATAMLQVAVDVTHDLLEHGESDRRTALDLLVVDALVTHALEQMTRDPEAFDAQCLSAMRRLAAVTGAP